MTTRRDFIKRGLLFLPAFIPAGRLIMGLPKPLWEPGKWATFEDIDSACAGILEEDRCDAMFGALMKETFGGSYKDLFTPISPTILRILSGDLRSG